MKVDGEIPSGEMACGLKVGLWGGRVSGEIARGLKESRASPGPGEPGCDGIL